MLPILLTKTGIGSRIGCLRIISSTQIAIDGTDESQILIDGGSNDVSMKLIKDNQERVVITSGTILPTTADSKTLTLNYSYTDSTLKLLSSSQNGGQSVTLGSLSLTSSNYQVQYNCTHLNAVIGLHLSNIGPYVTNVKIKFGVYIGGHRIAYANASISELQTSSIYTYKSLYIPLTRTKTSFSGGNYSIVIKDVSVTCTYGGQTRSMNCVLKSMILGTGSSSSSWTNGNIAFSTSLLDKVTIGSNGVQIESKSGLVQILNGQDNAFIKMYGLPTSGSGLEDDRLYEHVVDFEDFKSSLQTTLHSDYFSVKSGVTNAVYDMANKLPSKFRTVAIKRSN